MNNSPPIDAYGIEKRDLTLGLVPLTDCAPIAVAVERGFFNEVGLNVSTTRENSWAGIRDKVAYGVLDAAQMLATMPLCATLGIGGLQCDMVVNMTLDLNGNAITLSKEICDNIRQLSKSENSISSTSPMTAEGLSRVINDRKNRNLDNLKFGIVFPMSTHDLELRYWLAHSGIDPDHDVDLVVVPPPRMAEAMQNHEIDGFCVGEPWNTIAVKEGIGEVAITKYDIWNNSPEKVLGTTSEWASSYPNTLHALAYALVKACQWIDNQDNREETCDILSLPQYVGVDKSVLIPSMTGNFKVNSVDAPRVIPDFHVFNRYSANISWHSHAIWFLHQIDRWQTADVFDITASQGRLDIRQVLNSVYREDIILNVLNGMGLPIPDQMYKREGYHKGTWILPSKSGEIEMGPDLLFDQTYFHPHDIEAMLSICESGASA